MVVAFASLITIAVFVTQCQVRDKTKVTERPLQFPLHQLTTSKLLNRPRTNDVCRELLRRSDVSKDTICAALTRLATINDKSQADILLLLIEELNNGHSDALNRNLSLAAFHLPVEEKSTLSRRLPDIAFGGSYRSARTAAFATWLVVDDNHGHVFAKAGEQPKHAIDLLTSLPLLPAHGLQAKVYENVRRLLPLHESTGFGTSKQTFDKEVAETAISVMVDLHGRDRQKAGDLVQLIRLKRIRPSAFRGLTTLPTNAWPVDELNHLAAETLAFIAEVSTDRQSDHATQHAIQVGKLLLPLLPVEKRQRFSSRLRELTDYAQTIQ